MDPSLVTQIASDTTRNRSTVNALIISMTLVSTFTIGCVTMYSFSGSFDTKTPLLSQLSSIWEVPTVQSSGADNYGRLNYDSATAEEPFVLLSSAFEYGGSLPSNYTCAANNFTTTGVSPPLYWEGAPLETVEFLVTMRSMNKYSWVVYSIPRCVFSNPFLDGIFSLMSLYLQFLRLPARGQPRRRRTWRYAYVSLV